MNYSSKFFSPIGIIHLTASSDALLKLDLEIDQKLTDTHTKTNDVLEQTKQELTEYFKGFRKIFSIPLQPAGSVFQQRTWNALLNIPYGQVITYGQQAMLMNTPKACRAVGAANGKNPIPIIIPCHRVVGHGLKIGGFSSGLEIKRALLAIEGFQLKNGIVTPS